MLGLFSHACWHRLRVEIDSVTDSDGAVAPIDKLKHLFYLRTCTDETSRITPLYLYNLPRRTSPRMSRTQHRHLLVCHGSSSHTILPGQHDLASKLERPVLATTFGPQASIAQCWIKIQATMARLLDLPPSGFGGLIYSTMRMSFFTGSDLVARIRWS